MLPMPGDDADGAKGDVGMDMTEQEIGRCAAPWEDACAFHNLIMMDVPNTYYRKLTIAQNRNRRKLRLWSRVLRTVTGLMTFSRGRTTR